MGGYEIIRSRSETREKHSKEGDLASDAGRGSGTSGTVIPSPGVDCVAGADTDEIVARIVVENVETNGAVDCPIVTRGSPIDKAEGKHDTASVNTAVDVTTPSLKGTKDPTKDDVAHTTSGTTDICVEEAKVLAS